MIVFEVTDTEDHEVYRVLEVENGIRHYDFLRSIVMASLSLERPFLSHQVIKALNYHAIACLHTNAGEYRPCQVYIGGGEHHTPPPPWRVQALMDELVDSVNRFWTQSDPVVIAALVLWRLNNIHPFINGNGRTARAVCHFVLCIHGGGWLPGSPILPELLRQNAVEYVAALREADASVSSGQLNLQSLIDLIGRLLNQQLESVPNTSPT